NECGFAQRARGEDGISCPPFFRRNEFNRMPAAQWAYSPNSRPSSPPRSSGFGRQNLWNAIRKKVYASNAARLEARLRTSPHEAMEKLRSAIAKRFRKRS